jgi:hypothetical protein
LVYVKARLVQLEQSIIILLINNYLFGGSMDDFFPFLYKKEERKNETPNFLYLELDNIDYMPPEKQKEEEKVTIIEIL